MKRSNTVVINDVGPRDGLQNQPKILSVEQRLSLIRALLKANLPAIEVGAIVSPKAVPAMAGTADIIEQLDLNQSRFSVLIPNTKGYELGKAVNAPVMSLVIAASNTMNEKNIRRSTDAIMEESKAILAQARADGINVQAYVATAWACPFEGKIGADVVVDLCTQLQLAGASKLVIADTIGAASPDQVHALLNTLTNYVDVEHLACHFHDTRAMGLANVYAALLTGVREFDASIAGLGGCPFAPGASGNVATEDVALLVNQMGYDTHINMEALLAASDLAIELTGTAKGGKAKSWLEQNLKKGEQA
jgi:hydroxymethylglutaryl-CoA lyase